MYAGKTVVASPVMSSSTARVWRGSLTMMVVTPGVLEVMGVGAVTTTVVGGMGVEDPVATAGVGCVDAVVDFVVVVLF